MDDQVESLLVQIGGCSLRNSEAPKKFGSLQNYLHFFHYTQT